MALTHSARCVEQTQAHDAFMRKYPRACMRCGATGVIAYPSTRDDPGGSDPCPQCVENNRCPRCGTMQSDEWDGEFCDTCNWEWDDGVSTQSSNDGPMYMPDNECICAFEVVCPDCKGTGTVTVVMEGNEPWPAKCPECDGNGCRWVEGPIDIPYQPEMWTIFGEIMAERVSQDLRWGGPAHDDIHKPAHWSRLIFVRVQRLMLSVLTLHVYRQLLIEIAAMCVAAVQTLDRQRKGTANGKETTPGEVSRT